MSVAEATKRGVGERVGVTVDSGNVGTGDGTIDGWATADAISGLTTDPTVEFGTDCATTGGSTEVAGTIVGPTVGTGKVETDGFLFGAIVGINVGRKVGLVLGRDTEFDNDSDVGADVRADVGADVGIEIGIDVDVDGMTVASA